jgi:mono/diheme cytochrome c family protein
LETEGLNIEKELLMERSQMRILSMLTLLMAVAVVDSAPSIAADVNHGREVAQRWCVSCHLVDASQRQTTTAAPPFATIAGKSDFDVDRLSSFLLEPYPRMPNMSLTRAEAADIAAYIGSLRKY